MSLSKNPLITVHTFEQRSEEWHEFRKYSIGGSEVKPAYSKDNSVFKAEVISRECVEGWEADRFVSEDMERGIALEPLAKETVQDYLETVFTDVGMVTNKHFPGFHLSPDGVHFNKGLITKGIEIKCPKTKNHVKAIITNRVPAEYNKQILHYFSLLPDLATLYFCSFDPLFKVKPLHVIEITRESMSKEILSSQVLLKQFREDIETAKKEIYDDF